MDIVPNYGIDCNLLQSEPAPDPSERVIPVTYGPAGSRSGWRAWHEVVEATYERSCYCVECGRFLLSFHAFTRDGQEFRALFLPPTACFCSLRSHWLQVILDGQLPPGERVYDPAGTEAIQVAYVGRAAAALLEAGVRRDLVGVIVSRLFPLSSGRELQARRILAQRALQTEVTP